MGANLAGAMIPFAQDLASGKLDPVYILVSAEPLLVTRALAAIRDAAVPESARAWSHDVFDGRGATGEQIRAAADTLPMMSARRLVEVRGVHQMSAGELAALVPYIERPNPRTVLVMTATKVDKRIKLFATARKAGFLWELAAPRRLRGWVEAEAESLGVTLARGAGSRLVEVVGKDVSRLAVALEMLSLYTGGAPVTAEAVDDLIAHTRESSVFELTDAIGDGDQMAALTAIASLIDQRQSALGAVMMLARHVRQLIRARLLVGGGAGTAEIASQLKVPPFIADKVAGQARRASLRGLVRSLQRLSAADRALKGQELKMRTLGKSLGERVVLEELARELIDLQR